MSRSYWSWPSSLLPLWAGLTALALVQLPSVALAGHLDQQVSLRTFSGFIQDPNDAEIYPNDSEVNQQVILRDSLRYSPTRRFHFELNVYNVIIGASDKTSLVQDSAQCQRRAQPHARTGAPLAQRAECRCLCHRRPSQHARQARRLRSDRRSLPGQYVDDVYLHAQRFFRPVSALRLLPGIQTGRRRRAPGSQLGANGGKFLCLEWPAMTPRR